MADIVAQRLMIQQEETKPQAAVTESVMSRVGAGINFINQKQLIQTGWNINGKYNQINPNLSVDGFVTNEFNYEIIDLIIKIGDQQGTSGITELDLKWKPFASGTWQSIFSTTPKFAYTATPDSAFKLDTPPSAPLDIPVLSKTTFNAFDMIKLDQLQVQGGSPNSYFVKLFIRPTN